MMKPSLIALAVLTGVLSLTGCTAETPGSDAHAHHHAEAFPAGSEQPSLVILSDAAMLDQEGRERRLKSDVAGSRIIVVDFIFTSCQTICPVTTSLMAEAHRRLSDLPPEEVAFVSMSIDANVDTPERLKAFATRHGANWTFLTGEKRIMDEALVRLSAYATNPEDHAAMILIGDASTGSFSRIYGLPDPEMVEARVRKLLETRSHGVHQH